MRAFKLAAQVASEGFSGGTVSYGPDHTAFDVGAALESRGEINPEGIIVTDAPTLIQALEQYPALVSTEVPEGVAPVDAPGEPEPMAASAVGVISQSPAPVQDSQVAVMPEPPADDRIEDTVAAVHGDDDDAEVQEPDNDDDDLGIHQ